VVIGTVLALVLVVGIGWPKSKDYVKDRYQASTAPHDFPVGMKAALAWFNRAEPHDSRIAVVGGRPGFKQYVFYGDDLSNHVQYVAKHGPHGAYLPIASEAVQKDSRNPSATRQCQEWIRDLNDGDYGYAVIGPDQRTQSIPPVEAAWTAAAGGRRLETADDVSVFKLDPDLDPTGCTAAGKGARVVIGAIDPGKTSLSK
jgi:hypothetical protein